MIVLGCVLLLGCEDFPPEQAESAVASQAIVIGRRKGTVRSSVGYL